MVMKLNLKQLQAIEVLAKTKNFRIASEKLCISQPALSKQIKAFEQRYGLELFERSPTGAVLSHQGQMIINEILSLNRHAERLDTHIKRVVENDAESLQIGFGKSSSDFLPEIIQKFRSKQSNVSLSLHDLASHEQKEKLLDGLLDVAFMRDPKHSDLEKLRISSDEIVLVVSKFLYQGEDIQYYLDNYDLLTLQQSQNSALNRQVKNVLMSFNYRDYDISSDIQTILMLVMSGAGVAILPKKSIAKYSNDVKFITFSEDASWNIYMVWKADVPNKSIAGFTSFVKNWMNQRNLEH